ncbi:MAG TPA: glycosyltransferase family 39 protein, partial [Tepidisphaeraceae bacterium]|nr:glycosyltransferase family 39 protein [Tepidisphaeraceae bacterium]
MRSAGYDVFLLMFAALANAALLRALVHQDGRWLLAAGAGIGLGILTKGPVILLQTILPALAWALWMRRRETPVRVGRPWLAGGVLVLLLAGLPWFVYVALAEAGAIERWTVEVTRQGVTDLSSSSLLQYLQMIPMMTPWAVLFVAGAVVIWQQRRTAEGAKLMWALLAGMLPLVVMTLFRDRKERYMLPMVVPASVVVSAAMLAHLRTWRAWMPADRWCVTLHWALLAIIAIGVPVAGALGVDRLTTREGLPWWSMPVAVMIALLLSAVIGVSAWIHARRWPGGILIGTAAPMLVVFAMLMYGYASSSEGRSPLRSLTDAIRAIGRPVVVVHNLAYPERPPEEVSIYLNQTIRRVGGPNEIARDDMVLITRERTSDPLPPPDVRGWERIAEAQEGRSRYGAWRLRSPEQPQPDRKP